jgi:hypothetical protein
MESVMTFLMVLLVYLWCISYCVGTAKAKGYNPKVAALLGVCLPFAAMVAYWALRPTREKR